MLSKESVKESEIIMKFVISSIICFLHIKNIELAIISESNTINRFSNNTEQKYGLIKFYDDAENLVEPTFETTSSSETEALQVDDKVFFMLYTEGNREGELLYLNDIQKLRSSKFDKRNETVFITHGWKNSARGKACALIKDAYLQHGNYNVIAVDWSKISEKSYDWAASEVKKVGQYVALMIDFLEDQGMSTSTTKLIGHSLGAHVMGSAGYHAKNIINYVVGLDPTLLLFEKAQPATRISTHDALNVEVIHTNGGNLGFYKPIGHVDFYPNGGQKQPGCPPSDGGACSHSRSYELYAESINSHVGFYGRQCNYSEYTNLWSEICTGPSELMGSARNKLNFRGVYLLQTHESQPFVLDDS